MSKNMSQKVYIWERGVWRNTHFLAPRIRLCFAGVEKHNSRAKMQTRHQCPKTCQKKYTFESAGYEEIQTFWLPELVCALRACKTQLSCRNTKAVSVSKNMSEKWHIWESGVWRNTHFLDPKISVCFAGGKKTQLHCKNIGTCTQGGPGPKTPQKCVFLAYREATLKYSLLCPYVNVFCVFLELKSWISFLGMCFCFSCHFCKSSPKRGLVKFSIYIYIHIIWMIYIYIYGRFVFARTRFNGSV